MSRVGRHGLDERDREISAAGAALHARGEEVGPASISLLLGTIEVQPIKIRIARMRKLKLWPYAVAPWRGSAHWRRPERVQKGAG